VGLARATATVLTQLATVRYLRGQISEARETFGEVLALLEGADISEELAGPQAIALTNFAELEFHDGNPARAIELGLRALEVSRRVNDRENVVLLCCNLAGYSARAERYADARTYAREALELLGSDKQSFLVAAALESLAHVACAAGDLERAARLAGFADARRTALSATREAGERESFERLMASLDVGLGSETLAARLREGETWTPENAFGIATNV
jgi:tetratricopeptide (TPR) repeat protein